MTVIEAVSPQKVMYVLRRHIEILNKASKYLQSNNIQFFLQSRFAVLHKRCFKYLILSVLKRAGRTMWAGRISH